MSVFLLVRHGHSTAGNRLTGRLPGIHLSGEGRDQAGLLAENLSVSGVDLIFSSPLERTRETALPLSVLLRRDVRIDESFTEVDFGSWSGLTFDELERDPRWKQFHVFRTGTRCPDGELMSEVQLRFVRRLESLRREYPDSVIAVFSHADPIRSALCHYLGVPLDFMLRLDADPGSVGVLRIADYGPRISCVNCRPPLPSGFAT